MRTLITLTACLLSFGVTYANDYSWLKESLQPIVKECVAVKGAVGNDIVLINLKCMEADENGEIQRTDKKLFIDLITKTWTRQLGRFTLLN